MSSTPESTPNFDTNSSPSPSPSPSPDTSPNGNDKCKKCSAECLMNQKGMLSIDISCLTATSLIEAITDKVVPVIGQK